MSGVRTVRLGYGNHVFVCETLQPKEVTEPGYHHILDVLGQAVRTTDPKDTAALDMKVTGRLSLTWITNPFIIFKSECDGPLDAYTDPPNGHKSEYSWVNVGIPDNGGAFFGIGGFPV